MKDNCKSVCLDSGIDIEKVHGHMDLVLTNVKTGEVEEVHEDNLITNAIRDYFANCGFMNYPNLDKSQLVQLLMGGVMLFDDNISENADIVFAPAGLHMTANAAQGYTNNVPNTEQGTATANDGSTVYNGWQPDGSYLHTYEWNTTQGNSNKGIACVCLANKEYAWAGEGNCESGSRHSTRANINNLYGSVTSQSGFSGYVYNIDLTASTCCTFAIETRTDEQEEEYTTGVFRKYRIPVSKLNLKGTPTAPVLLSETEVVIDADLKTASVLTQPFGTSLLLWNVQDGAAVWGDTWTQYLWTVTSSGTISKQTVTNATGETEGIYGLQAAHFDGNYCFFVSTTQGAGDNYKFDTTKIYVWNRSNNSMFIINNPYGYTATGAWAVNWRDKYANAGWYMQRGSGDGKLVILGYSHHYVVDAVLREAAPINASDNSYVGNLTNTSGKMIKANGINLYRSQTYIASINNLANTVYKNSEKTMKLTYRITFDEE